MKEAIARFLTASVAIPAVVLGLALLIFPLFYFVAPVLFPVSVYLKSSTASWVSAVAWSGAIGTLFAWLSRSQPKLKSLGIYLLIVVAGACLIHAPLQTLGHSIYMETP